MTLGFGQSGFTILAPVLPGEEEALRVALDPIGRDPSKNTILPFEHVALLHFCSFVIIPVDEGALLMFEGNIDGPVDVFLTELVGRAGAGLDTIFRYCSGYPRDSAGKARYLLEHDRGFNTFYVGCPGRTLSQIRQEELLREKVQMVLDSWKGAPPDATSLRQAMKGSTPDKPVVRPFLVRYGTMVLVGLAISFFALLVGSVYLATGSIGGTLVVLLALALSLGAIVGLAALYLRRLEAIDPVDENRFYASSVDAAVKREDFGMANHFAAVTFIKPGWFRHALLRGVLAAIHLAGLFVANKGQLAGIPTIHFARWLIIDERRLLFLSNYGGSWENYLNDFIDKAHGGLTAVWSNTGGFPRSRYLFGEGATQEREFKVYARNSQLTTLVWYQAYPNLTTVNIENNTRICEGLLNPDSEDERRWLARL